MKRISLMIAAIVSLALAGACGKRPIQPPMPQPEPAGSPGDPDPLMAPMGQPVAMPEATPDAAAPAPTSPGSPLVPGSGED